VHSQGNGQVTVRRVDPTFFWPPSRAVGPRLPCLPGRLEAGERVPAAAPPVPLLPPIQRSQMPAEAICLSTCPMPQVSPASASIVSASPAPPASPCGSNKSLKLPARFCPQADLLAWEVVSPGVSPRGVMTHRAESDTASTCAGWGATSASEEEEEEVLSPCRPTVKNTFINIDLESSFLGSARRRTQSEPKTSRHMEVDETEGVQSGASEGIRQRWSGSSAKQLR